VESLDRLIWAVIVLVAAFVVTALLLSNFHLAWQTFAAPALACSTLLAGGWFYSRWRADARLASGLFSTAQLIAFAAVAAPLSYIAASANLPLCDAALDTMDRALGFDWKALLAWMNTVPLPRAAPDLSESHAANDDGGAVSRLLRPASMATDLYSCISLRGSRLHCDICRVASRGCLAPLRPYGKRFRDIAHGKHQLACILRIARRKLSCPRSGRFRGDHHLPEPACRAGRSRYCRALAGEIPALGGSHPQYSDAHRYTHRRLALFQRRPRRSGFGRFIPPHRSDSRSAGARTSSTARGELAPSACCVFAFSSRRSARACAFRTI
jgi:hypothetical protein